jgi:mRNA interferase HigB
MRVIRRKTLAGFWRKYADAEQPLKAWFAEAGKAKWKDSNDLKKDFPKASVITRKRTVFNIKSA